MSNLMGNDLYLRITKNNGESHVQHHRVWDAARFTESMTKQHSEAKNPNDRCTVSVATKQDYQKGIF
jgi:hypothetical protein